MRQAIAPAKTGLPLAVYLYMFAVLLPVMIQLGPLNMTVLRLYLLLIFIPLVAKLLSGECGRLIPTDYLFFAHIGWVGLALLWNNPSDLVQQTSSIGLEFLGGYLIGRCFIRDQETFQRMILFFSWCVICLLPLALYETLTGYPILIETIRKLPVLNTVERIIYPQRMGLFRTQVVFAHPIHFGIFCSLAFTVTFVGLYGKVSHLRRYFMSGLVAATSTLALSSGALLSIVFQMGLLGWFFVFASNKYRWWLLFASAVFSYIFVDIFSNRSPVYVFMSYATFSAHNAYWRAEIFHWGMINIWGSPIFGIGMKDWVRPAWMHSSSVDNFWLLIAMRYGIPSLLLLVAGYLSLIVSVARQKVTEENQFARLRRAWMITIAGISFSLTTVHVWTNTYSFVFFFLGAGVWMFTSDRKSDENLPSALPARTEVRYTRFENRARE